MPKVFPAFVLCLAVSTTTAAKSDHPMPPAPAGLVTTTTMACKDNATQIHGECKTLVDAEGRNYLVFRVDGQIAFIREFFLDERPFVELWVSDTYITQSSF